MPRALVQQAHCWLCKQASIEFVKQTKHDERVAPDHEHHDRADHDEHGTNISQQAAWCVLIGTSFAPHLQHHAKQVAGKLTVSSCSRALAGERAACSTFEPTTSHNRCERRERTRPPTSRCREIGVIGGFSDVFIHA